MEILSRLAFLIDFLVCRVPFFRSPERGLFPFADQVFFNDFPGIRGVFPLPVWLFFRRTPL